MNQMQFQADRVGLLTLVAAGLALAPTPAFAQTDQALLTRLEQMELEIGDLKTRLEKAEGRAAQPAPGPIQDQAVPETANYRSITPRASMPGLSGTAIHFGGYADVGVAISDRESGTKSTFVAGTFNPALYLQYKNLLLFESELEIAVSQDGATDVGIEFVQFDLLLHDNVTLVAGKYLSPVGQYQERLHPSWINRLADSPAGFGHGGVQPGAEVGLQLRGGVPLGRARFTYALAVGNGPRLDGGGEVMTEGFGGDDNNSKAISGRIGVLPLPYLEFGASMLRAKVRGPVSEDGAMSATRASFAAAAVGESVIDFPSTDVDYRLWGLDAAYTRGPWDVRVEYLHGVRDRITVPIEDGGEMEFLPSLRMTAWYAQMAYRLSGLTQHPILGNFEPVVRYGEYKVRGLEELEMEAAEKRWDLGLNYWFAPAIVLHGAVQHRNFTRRQDGDDDRDTRLLFKLAYGF